MANFLQTLLPLVGAAAGGGIGAMAGNPIMGASIGASLGQAGAAGIGLLDKPDVMGATPQQQQIMNIQLRNLERTSALQGMSPQMIQNQTIARQAGVSNQLSQANGLGQNISPLDRQNLIQGLMTLMQDKLVESTGQTGALDIQAEAQRIAQADRQAAAAAQQAEAIRQAEAYRQQREKQLLDQGRANFAQALTGAGVAASQLVGAVGTTPNTTAEDVNAIIGQSPTDTRPVVDQMLEGSFGIPEIRSNPFGNKKLEGLSQADTALLDLLLL
jgi:hypothetical protein